MAQTDKKLKVLMLGWEFPPVMAGGLGTACYGLSKAMHEYVDLTLILPKTVKAVQHTENGTLLGMNYYGLVPELTPPNLNGSEERTIKTHYVEANDINPYPFGIAYEEVSYNENADAEYVRNLYSSNEPYGSNIMEKVKVYADTVVQVAMGLDFDIIHAHDWVTYPAATRIQELTGKPLVLHIHSLETDRIGTHAKHQINAVYEIEKNGMLKADRLIPVSFFTKDCAIEHYGINPDKFYPVYNGIDSIPTYRIPREIDEKIVLFLGRVTFQKGPEYMAETAFKLVQKNPKVKFFVAGVGDQLQKLKDLCQFFGIYDKFIFGGFLPKARVHQILAQSDVYFMPSVSEPFGLSALEAAQFGIPCVLSEQSGVAEVLNHALKADYWDTDAFANYIYALLSYEGIRKDLEENAVVELESITWDDSAKDVMAVYHTL